MLRLNPVSCVWLVSVCPDARAGRAVCTTPNAARHAPPLPPSPPSLTLPPQASGFCYVNDIVLAILELLKKHRSNTTFLIASNMCMKPVHNATGGCSTSTSTSITVRSLFFMGRSAACDACAQAMEWKKLSSLLTV